MWRRRFFALALAALVAGAAGQRRQSVEVCQEREPTVDPERERCLRMIDQVRQEVAVRSRQLELQHRSLTAQLEFTGIDFVGPPTTDVHVLLDGTSIFDGEVSSYGGGPSFTTTLSLKAGDTVDFVVGRGTDGTYNYDSTRIAARLDTPAVPEPTSIWLLGTGLTGMFLLARRRKGCPA